MNNNNNGFYPPRPSPPSKKLSALERRISQNQLLRSNLQRSQAWHPFSSRSGNMNHFPGLENAFNTGKKEFDQNKSAQSELDLSIGARADLAEHNRYILKHGIDGNSNSSPAKSFFTNSSDFSQKGLEDEWNCIVNESTVSYSLTNVQERDELKSFNTPSESSEQRVFLSSSMLSKLRSPVKDHNKSNSFIDQSSDFFNSSRVQCLVTPEKNKPKVDEISRLALLGNYDKQIGKVPFSTRNNASFNCSESITCSTTISRDFNESGMAGLFSAALRLGEEAEKDTDEHEISFCDENFREKGSLASFQVLDSSSFSNSKEFNVFFNESINSKTQNPEIFDELEPNISNIEGEESFMKHNVSLKLKGSGDEYTFIDNIKYTNGSSDKNNTVDVITQGHDKNIAEEPLVDDKFTDNDVDRLSEIINPSGIVVDWPHVSTPSPPSKHANHVKTKTIKEFIEYEIEDIGVSEILSSSMMESSLPNKSLPKLFESPELKGTNNTYSQTKVSSSFEIPVKVILESKPTCQHTKDTKEEENIPSPLANTEKLTPIEFSKKSKRDGGRFDFLDVSPIEESTPSPNIKGESDILRYSNDSIKNAKAWLSPNRDICNHDLDDFVIHEDYAITDSPVSNLNESRFSYVLREKQHSSALLPHSQNKAQTFQSSTQGKGQDPCTPRLSRLAERYSTLERYDSFSPPNVEQKENIMKENRVTIRRFEA